MKPNPTLNWLVPVVLLMVLTSAGVGLFYMDEGRSFQFTSLRGETVDIYGRGLYRYDSAFQAPISRGTDLVALALAVPLVLAGFILYRRGSLRGALLLTGALAFPLYYAVSLSFGTAYNSLILVYILMLAETLIAQLIALRMFDLAALPAHFKPGLPHRGLSIFLIVSGIAVAGVWLSSILGPLLAGQPPAELGIYTTVITYALDLGIIAPILIASGLMVRKRDPLGYVAGITMLVLCAEIGFVVVSQTLFQRAEGIFLNPMQMAIFVGSFVVLTLFALRLLVLIFRNVSEEPVRRLAPAAKRRA